MQTQTITQIQPRPELLAGIRRAMEWVVIGLAIAALLAARTHWI
jgi:hypothetical protein